MVQLYEGGLAEDSCRVDPSEGYGDMKLILHRVTNPNIV
jgi:hypothetical protein